jgi:hypothetical protein
MACGCQSTNPCVSNTVTLTNCDGCTYTVNADCVIYNGDKLTIEGSTVTNGSARTLSSILTQISNSGSERESKIIEFTASELTGSYTLVETDVNKILLLTFFDDLYSPLSTSYTINLPNTLAFTNQEIIIKNIMSAVNPATTFGIRFNQNIQYGWHPTVLTSNLFSTLDSPNGVVRLRYVKVTPTSYQWIVVD